MPTLTDYLESTIGGSAAVAVVKSTWVQLTNNSTAVTYVSTAATDSAGKFTINNLPAGSYSVATGPSATGPWTATGDTNYLVAPTAADNTSTFPGAVTVPSLTDTGLTAAQIPFADTGGLLATDATLTFNKTTKVAGANAVSVAGLTGAVAGGRFVGFTAYGSPATGTFSVGDSVISRASGSTFVCTVAGTPGTWIVKDGRYNVLDYGADPTGIADSQPAVVAAQNAAVAGSYKGTVFFPDGAYKLSTPVTVTTGVKFEGTWRGPQATDATHQWGSVLNPTTSAFIAPVATNSIAFERLGINGGTDQLLIGGPAGTAVSEIVITDCMFISPSGSCLKFPSNSTGQERIHVTRTQFVAAGASGVWVAGGYLDKTTFIDCLFGSNAVNGFRFDSGSVTSVSVLFLRCTNQRNTQSGWFLGNGVGPRSWTWMACSTEDNGYGSQVVGATTGSITSGAAVLTVASGVGYSNGDTVTVQGAGPGGTDLITTISSGGGTTALTLAATASTTVSSAEVVKWLYSDVDASGAISAGTFAFINNTFKNASVGACRYSIDARGLGALDNLVIGGEYTRPMNDAGNTVSVWGPLPIRAGTLHPYSVNNDYFQRSTLGSGGIQAPPGGSAYLPRSRNEIVTPPGGDLVVGLADSTKNGGGTLGQLQVWKSTLNHDAGHDQLLWLDPNANAGVGMLNVGIGIAPCHPSGRTGFNGGAIWGGAGVPANNLGTNGDYYFRQDTPLITAQRRYMKVAGAWIADSRVSQTLTFGATVTPDASQGDNMLVTYTSSFTLAAPLNPSSGQLITVKFIHDATANVYAITWNGVYKRAGAAFANTNTASAVDTISFEYDGVNWNEIGRAINLG